MRPAWPHLKRILFAIFVPLLNNKTYDKMRSPGVAGRNSYTTLKSTNKEI